MTTTTAVEYPALTGQPVTEAHARICRYQGHAVHTVDGQPTGECPRCGEVTTADPEHGARCDDPRCCPPAPAGALVLRYADGTVVARDLDNPAAVERMRSDFEYAAIGADVEPWIDAWHVGPTGEPVRVRALHDVEPFDGDDYAGAVVRFVVDSVRPSAPGLVSVDTVATVSYRIDGRA